MPSVDDYKEEALRLCNVNPLDVCTRITERLHNRGWTVADFDCHVTLAETIDWTASVSITSDRCMVPPDVKRDELFKILMGELELNVQSIKEETHRKYGAGYGLTNGHGGRRVVTSNTHEFRIEFKPAVSIGASVLIE